MEKYEENLERESSDREIEVVEMNLDEFFNNKFKITKLGNWLDVRKGRNLIAHFNLPDEKIYVIDKKYKDDLERFSNFYQREVGVDFKLIL